MHPVNLSNSQIDGKVVGTWERENKNLYAENKIIEKNGNEWEKINKTDKIHSTFSSSNITLMNV